MLALRDDMFSDYISDLVLGKVEAGCTAAFLIANTAGAELLFQ
jgi:hypothetical protein